MKKDSWHEVGRLSAVTGTTEQELLDSLMFFDRDNIASVLTGYFSGLVESKELFRAFEFLEHEKIDLFFTDIDSKKLSVLEKLVQVEEDHGRNSDESCKVRKILWKLVDDKYSKTTELAAACEEKRPEEAYGIYLEGNESDLEAWFQKGLCSYYYADYETAITDFSAVLDLDNMYSTAIEWRGKSYQKGNYIEKACSDWSLSKEQGLRSTQEYLDKYCTKGN